MTRGSRVRRLVVRIRDRGRCAGFSTVSRCLRGQPAQRFFDVGDCAVARRQRPRRADAFAGRCEVPVRIVTVNFVPRPSSLSTVTPPPWRRASSCTSASPMPVPSCVRARLCFDAVETLEHARKLGLGNADARIGDPQLDEIGAALQGDRDAAFERELEGVRQQVEDDLLPHVAIDVDGFAAADRTATTSSRPARSIADRNTLASSAVNRARSVGS